MNYVHDYQIDRGRFGPSGLGMLVTARASFRVMKPAFYREPGRRSEKNKVLEATVHPSAELSDSSVPSSSPTSKKSKQTQSNQTVAPKRAQEKRLVTNSPRPRTSYCIKRNKHFKSEDKTKADLRQSGSISFGRFKNEALCWERRSSFTHNRATTLLENEKYQASENEGYAGSFEHVNEVGVLHALMKIMIAQPIYQRMESIKPRIQAMMEILSAENSAFNDPKVSSGSKANVLNQHKSTEEQPISIKVVASRASCTKKVSHRLYQSVNRKRKKHRSNSYGEISISKQLPCPPSTVNLTTAQKKPRPSTAAGARSTSATDNTVRCLRAEVYYRCSTNEHLNVADSPQVSEVTIYPSAELSDSSVPSVATRKMSKQTQSNRTVAPKRDQEKRQVANYPRPRTSDSIRRNKDFKDEDKTKVLARRIETMQRERMLEVWT
ncbi:hypothetical protein CQW23_09221 [Capsicum baccatum]|uniref:Uncharacterized protein n=1 Tax=Capsicum baccatum TaxID=33114 RepID=A0A2G2WW56_CAPBA|nr:hypothetical protein CQW23_09221 [Capsicum baccatum]